MTLPEPVSQAAKWALVVGLAFYSADATAALIQRQLRVAPKPLPQASVGEVQDNVPAQAAPPGLVSLLETTAPETPLEVAGAPPSEAGGAGTAPGDRPAPSPPGKLQLRGTMAGGGGTGLAMIDVNGQTQVVSTGEEIGGMILTSVSPYSVTLEFNGQLQVLDMNADGPVAAIPPPQPAAPTPEVEDTPSDEETPAEEDAEAILTQRQLRNILDNPAQFAGKGFRMKPVLNGGEIIGMRVSIQNPSHPLARLGIQDGDVVKSLNGTPLNGPEALSSIYRLLRNTSNLSFEVDRGGQSEKIEITLEE